MQGVTDSRKGVIGYHGQEKDVQSYKKCEKIHLGDADFIGDTFALDLDVPQHLWDGGAGETDVYKGQVGEEEVHGGVEVGSELTARMMSRFPNTVVRYVERKSPNMRGCSSGSFDNPRRRNSEICVSFPDSM